MKKSNNPFLGKRFKYNPSFKNSYMSPFALESQARIKAKIKDGLYKHQKCQCFCGSEDSVLLAQMDSYGNYYPFVICKRCGLIRAEPRLTDESYIDFYRSEYRILYGEYDRDKDELWIIRMNRAKEVYDYIINHIKLPRKAIVFDIGCNMGTMLLPFYENGHEVMGIDYGKDNIEYGKRKAGLHLEVGSLEKLKAFGKKADLILLNHVLEHFSDLENKLKAIREVMKPDAFIFIAAPGTFWIYNLSRGNIMAKLQNAHTWQFSLDSLRFVMECCGFELIYGNEEIKAIFKVSNIFRDKKNIQQDEFRRVLAYLESTERKYLPKYYVIRLLELVGFKEMAKSIILKFSNYIKI